MRRLPVVALGVGLLAIALALIGRLPARRAPTAPLGAPATSPRSETPSSPSPPSQTPVEVVVMGLEVPWALAFAPDGTLYVTERPGRLSRVRQGHGEKVADIPEVRQTAEGGLLGLALDPHFAENQHLYLFYSYRSIGQGTLNRVVRYRLAADSLRDAMILLDAIPGAQFHDGGRVKFGPDGNLYITTGDAARSELAQEITSLAGKILRIRPDGGIPSGNPFPSSPVYSFGHRNPQGLAWTADGALYSTEHGPSGPPPDCCHDEVNRIEAGKNYGWPVFAGNRQQAGGNRGNLVPPVIESGPTETWAPAGAAIVGRTMYFAGLRGQALFALDLDRPERGVEPHFAGRFGRLRDVVVGPDGALYVTTSNWDGRGQPRPGDDRILRIDPLALPGGTP